MSQLRIENNQSYTVVTFKKVELSDGSIVGAQFTECTFKQCDFSDTAFIDCRFIGCEFDNCAMKLTKLENTTFGGGRFHKCNLLGINWTEANWSDWATKLNPIEFDMCDLKYGVFFGLELNKMQMRDCTAHEVNFSEAVLTESNFKGTDFTDAIFLRTDVTKANFVGAKNYAINLNDNPSKGAKFSLPEAIRLLHYLDISIVDPQTNRELDDDSFNQFIS